ncbi:hypothetical protein [Erysipelothrix anatis]|uniref:hypothetical protein n=1 Tax=Erysipelothrix anatis TaxID=2683713 RepID=UPI0013581EC5|nr:hypothetical protein [Erysipelothrix anatis]
MKTLNIKYKIFGVEITKFAYLTGVFAFTISLFFSSQYLGQFKTILGAVSILMFVAKILFTGYSRREILFYSCLGLIVLLSTYYSKRQSLLLSYLALVGSKKISIEDIFKVIFITGVVSIITSVSCYLIIEGFTSASTEARTMFGVTIQVSKNGLGYTHANMLYLLIFVVLSLYVYLKYEQLTVVNYIVMSIIVLVGFILTFSRSGLAVFIFSGILLTLLKKNYFKTAGKIKILKLLPLIIIILSFVLPYFYTMNPTGIMNSLNRSLSDRLYYAAEFLEVTESTLFGVDVAGLRGRPGFPLRADNSFVLIIRAYGLLVFILVLGITLDISRKRFTNKELFLILVMYMYCFTEGFYVIAVQNVAIFILFRKYFIEENEDSYER